MHWFSNRLLPLSLLLLLVIAPIAAQTATAITQERDIPVTLGAARVEAAPNSTGSSWPRTLIFLVLAVAAAWVALRLLRRARLGAGRNPQLFRHVACQPLPGGGVLHLVLVDEQLYLLGAHSGQLQLLDAISSDERRDRLLLLASQQPRARSFAAMAASIKAVK